MSVRLRVTCTPARKGGWMDEERVECLFWGGGVSIDNRETVASQEALCEDNLSQIVRALA